MKLKWFFAATIIGTLTLTACSSEVSESKPEKKKEQQVEQNKQEKTTTKEIGDIAFEYPVSLTEGPLEQGVGYIYDFDQEGTTMNVIVTNNTDSHDLKSYTETGVEQLKMAGYQVADVEYIETDEKTWNTIHITSGAVQMNQRTVLHNNTFYTFTFGGLETGYNQHFDTFNQIIESVVYNKVEEAATNQEGHLETFEDIMFHLPVVAQEYDSEDIGMPMKSYIIEKDGGVNFNVVVEDLAYELSIEEYTELALEQLTFNTVSTDFFPGEEFVWSELVHDEEGYVMIQRSFIVNNKAYVFSFAATDAKYETNKPLFDDIFESIRLK